MTEVLSDLRVIYDLHSHTTASDGELSPEELVDRAIERQINVLAITDHDTTAAITPANDYIAEKKSASYPDIRCRNIDFVGEYRNPYCWIEY